MQKISADIWPCDRLVNEIRVSDESLQRGFMPPLEVIHNSMPWMEGRGFVRDAAVGDSPGISDAHTPLSAREVTPQNETTSHDSLKDTLASMASGFAQATVGLPFDTVKTRIQSNALTTNTFRTAAAIYKEQGVAGYFKGYSSMLIGLQLINYILMPTYQFTRRQLDEDFKYMGAATDGLPNVSHVMLAGAAGGFAGSPVVCAFERIKVRLQYMSMVKPGHRETLPQAIRGLVRDFGVRGGLFTGYMPCMIRETGGNAFWFLGYEMARYAFSQYYGTEKVPLHALALSGSAAGISFWTTFCWLDTIKTVVQSRNLQGKDASMLRVAKLIKQESGSYWGLYRGYSSSIIRSIPTAGSIILAYESARRLLD